ncbi:MAG: pilus assembly FimT family protein, partial [Cognaticolwellia aestuarii]
MFMPSNYKAFTLIELLITMSIAALLMALVGPLTMNQIDSSNARAEVEKLKDVIRSVSTKAFSSGNSIEVNVED